MCMKFSLNKADEINIINITFSTHISCSSDLQMTNSALVKLKLAYFSCARYGSTSHNFAVHAWSWYSGVTLCYPALPSVTCQHYNAIINTSNLFKYLLSFGGCFEKETIKSISSKSIVIYIEISTPLQSEITNCNIIQFSGKIEIMMLILTWFVILKDFANFPQTKSDFNMKYDNNQDTT